MPCVVVAVALVFWLNRTPKAPAAPTLYTFATADAISGTYYPLGRGIAELVERAMPGVRIEVVPTEGSFENARLLESGEAQLAFMQSDIAFHSVKTDRVLGHRSDTIVGLAALYREYFHAVVRKDSGIETVNDLSKQRVSINLPNSGSRFTNDVVLEHFGVELAEENTRFLSTRDANIEILGGGLDASLQWFAAPHPNMVGVFRSGDVRLLQIPADLARGLQASQPFLLPGQIPGGTYPEQTEAVETVVVKALLVGRRDLPDEFVDGVARSALRRGRGPDRGASAGGGDLVRGGVRVGGWDVDRVASECIQPTASGAVGQGFESLGAHHLKHQKTPTGWETGIPVVRPECQVVI